MKLILHAGMPKAGSSALQATLARAHYSLLKKGVLYPLTEHVNQNFAVAGVVSVRPPAKGLQAGLCY